MNKEIERLEQRIEALEKTLAQVDRTGAGEGTLLVAPVRIVDGAGKLIAEISSENNNNSIRIFNAKDKPVASLGADGTESGYLAIRNKRERLVGLLDVERYGARLVLDSNNDNGGGLALFGADAGESGGGININPAQNSGGISLWAHRGSGEIRIEDAEGNELVIDAGAGDRPV